MTSEFAVAVHALVFLYRKADTISSEEIAKNTCTHAARVRKILVKLKRAGFLETKEGIVGGYHFCTDANTLTLRMIGDALGMKYVCSSWRSGGTDLNCMIASGMAGVMDDIYTNMNSACETYLDSITIADIDRRIFKNTLMDRKGI